RERVLAVHLVDVDVAHVVGMEDRGGVQADAGGDDGGGPGEGACMDVVRAADHDQAHRDEDANLAHTVVRKGPGASRVEEGDAGADEGEDDAPPAELGDDRRAEDERQREGDDHAVAEVMLTKVTLLQHAALADRKSTRLNSSHVKSSYAVLCLEEKNAIGDQDGQ